MNSFPPSASGIMLHALLTHACLTLGLTSHPQLLTSQPLSSGNCIWRQSLRRGKMRQCNVMWYSWCLEAPCLPPALELTTTWPQRPGTSCEELSLLLPGGEDPCSAVMYRRENLTISGQCRTTEGNNNCWSQEATAGGTMVFTTV